MPSPVWITAFVLSPVIVWLLWTGLIGDRARGRRRCPKCWHSLEGVPAQPEGGWICPECGKLAPIARHLLRTRRRLWRAPVAFVLIALTWYANGVYTRREEGWPAFAPNTFLIYAFPRDHRIFDRNKSWIIDTLRDRLLREKLTVAQYHALIARTLDISEDEVWERVLIRDRWPRGEPIVVRVARTDIACGLLGGTLEVTSPSLPENIRYFSHGLEIPPSRALVSYIMPVREGAIHPPVDQQYVDITLTAKMAAHSRSWSDHPKYVAKHSREVTRTFRVTLVDPDAAMQGAVIAPVRDQTLDSWLLSQIKFVANMNAYGSPIIHDHYLKPQRFDDEPGETCFVFDAEVRVPGETLWRMTCGVDTFGPHYPDEEEKRALFDQLGDDRSPEGLTLRLTPRPDIALHELRFDKYWVPADGEPFLEVPLSEVFEVLNRN